MANITAKDNPPRLIGVDERLSKSRVKLLVWGKDKKPVPSDQKN